MLAYFGRQAGYPPLPFKSVDRPISNIYTTNNNNNKYKQAIRDNTRSQNSVEYGMQQPDAPFNVSSYLRTETEATTAAAGTAKAVREV